MAKDKAHKASTNLESYSYYAIVHLIGIKGTNVSDVLSFIVKDWISDHRDELLQAGIDVKKWRAISRRGE